ncbi:putative uncharacterized protein DDB_G0282133 [Bradysia coprophila]|uniref:putative uncharacterized protein DDB_G0282133 n=1 Tax=Bradysia coprophila TaxID=38358 RepID=UPI00187DAED7|nr:putative uncharacterized protein DDB_G0282133 [Bradysia coprophila]
MFNEFKWFLIVVCLLVGSIDASKQSDKKSSQKKATYVKPTKTPKSILEQFKELPPDDLAFLKEVDKQFKNHGNNIKFRVVKDNSTNSKNQKRTINGDVGYGYQTNQHSQGYYFSKPKLEVYPYSQQDLPALTPQQRQALYQKYGPPNYQPPEVLSSYRNQHYLPQQLHTTVEISPSQGYEIKQTNNGYATYSQHNNDNYRPISFQSDHQTGPVIVLRIPGPQKYASHLQALLQQYLEIRAAEYIKLLQEHELQQQHIPQTHNYQQYSYEPVRSHQTYQNHYQQSYEQEPRYQVQVQPAQIIYQKHEEATDNGAHLVHYSHDIAGTEEQDDHDDQTYNYQQTYRPESRYSQQTEENEHYYHSNAYQHQSDAAEPQQHQHYVYPKIPSSTESSLQITENFPRDTHTHAYYTKSTTNPSTYVQPLHQSYEDQSQDQQYETYQPQSYQSEDYYYDTEHQSQSDKDYGSPSEHSVVAITQTTPAPYNYHAHPHPPQVVHAHRSHDDQSGSASHDDHSSSAAASMKGSKRQTATFTQEQYAKLNRLISRMKKKVANQAQKNKDE